jgi:hypothetical protein
MHASGFFWTMKKLFKRVLRKIGLIDDFTIELTISRQTLVDGLSKKMGDYQPDLFDIFTFNKKEYKGYIRSDKFEIKKCKSFIVSFSHWAEATGNINPGNNKLLVSIEIKSIQPYMVLIGFGLTALLFLTIGLLAIISTLATGEIEGLYAGFGILAFGTIFVGIQILVMRWSVSNLKRDLQDELKKIQE